ncbi:GNAT family N-acetyltransferase [Shewanella sp. 3B26]|uniref:GNAT family N-acetyltransferase n=1 Tax=Shewanella zhuhaiensis TaxID=2919576 RepID=A0AAJ1BE95_9GAMM|nr:GNAT family N-acetyltransferase [Shewanella zhuhaiensis]
MNRLTSPRLTLLPIQTDDRNIIVALNTNPDVMSFVSAPMTDIQANRTADIIFKQTATTPPKMYCWKILESVSGQTIGIIALTRMKADYPSMLEIGALSFPAFYGKGFIPEAMNTVCEFGLKLSEITGIYAKFQQDHQASYSITRKTGFSLPKQCKTSTEYLECFRTT